MSGELADMSLTAVAKLIRRGRASALEVTDACLRKIEAWQPRVNAFLEVEGEAARKAARSRDRELRRGEVRGPLHGVPLAHKDVFYREGRICSAGSKIRAGWVAGYTATVIDRLENAGAICLGRLGMAEFAADPTGHNAHYGACRNPWNTDYIPGASSSGAGAAVAARLVYGALGSDTGGSIRLPAAACGVVGLMPTQGRVSRHGATPRAWSLDRIGPMARSVADCALLLQTIAGHDPRDGMTADTPVPNYVGAMKKAPRGRTVGIPEDSFFQECDSDIRRALDDSVAVFRAAGMKTKRVPAPDSLTLFQLNDLVMKCEAATIHGNWLRERPEDYAPYLRARLEGGLLVPATQYIVALSLRSTLLSAFLDTTLKNVDALHFPVIAQKLPTLAQTELDADRPETLARAACLSIFTRLFNYLGVPAMSVPCGFDCNGLPIGFQLVGRPFDEGLLLALGHAYQRATGWHETAPAVSADSAL